MRWTQNWQFLCNIYLNITKAKWTFVQFIDLSPVINDHLVLHFIILNDFLIFNHEFDAVFLRILIISGGRIFSSIDMVVALDSSIGMMNDI